MESLLDNPSAAKALGVKPQTLAVWRVLGKSPEFVKVGARVFYRPSALEAFLDAHTRRSTSDHGA
jgi:hypothetical protein